MCYIDRTASIQTILPILHFIVSFEQHSIGFIIRNCCIMLMKELADKFQQLCNGSLVKME